MDKLDGVLRHSGCTRKFSEVIFTQLIDESGNTSYHAFTPETWHAFRSGAEGIRWTVPEHETTGSLPEEMASKVDGAVERLERQAREAAALAAFVADWLAGKV